jgi:hypothetical protein
LHQDEGQLVAFHHDIKHSAAHAERAGRCLYLIAARLLHAGDEAEGAARGAQHDIAGAALGVVNIFVELDFRMRSDADTRLIAQEYLGVAPLARAHGLIEE